LILISILIPAPTVTPKQPQSCLIFHAGPRIARRKLVCCQNGAAPKLDGDHIGRSARGVKQSGRLQQPYARWPRRRYPIPAAELKFLPRYRQIVETP